MIQFQRRFDTRKIKLFVFDLDGTLIDSRLDLIHSVNAMMRHLDRPELPGDVVASYVGDGAPMLVRRALGDPEDQNQLDRGLQYFLEYYREHKLDYTHLYDGVKETLAAIRQSQNGRPRHMAVLTNKPVNPSRAIVEALGVAEFFTSVYGGNSFPTKKPHPHGLLTILKETNSAPEESVMIGDSSIDIVTGRNASLWTCGVTYGFAPHTLDDAKPDVVVDTPQELAQIFR